MASLMMNLQRSVLKNARCPLYSRSISTSVLSRSSNTASTEKSNKDYVLIAPVGATTRNQIKHVTSYAFVVGLPLAVFGSGYIQEIGEVACVVAIPLHTHVGLRNIAADYIHTPLNVKFANAAIFALSGVTAIGLGMMLVSDFTPVDFVKALIFPTTYLPSEAPSQLN